MKHVLDYKRAPWAVMPEALSVIARVVGGEISDEELRERAEAQPQAGPQSRSTGGVAAIPLRGLITPRPTLMGLLFGGSGGLVGFRRMLHEAVGSDEITSIVIDVDSPGGMIDLVPEVAAEIRAARQEKPVVAVANTMAGSAAYWLASQASEIVVTPSGDVGSVGVFALHEDISRALDAEGIKLTFISAGKFKTEGNPYEPLGDEAKEAIQETVDEAYGMFVSDVAKGRDVSVTTVRDDYGQGRMLSARRAVKAGMADRVDTLEGTVSRMVRTPRRSRAFGFGSTGGQVETTQPVELDFKLGESLDYDAIAAAVAEKLGGGSEGAQPEADEPAEAPPSEAEAEAEAQETGEQETGEQELAQLAGNVDEALRVVKGMA